MCATGSEALRAASYAVAAGVCDVALAIGVEKLKDSGLTGVKGPAIVGDNPDGSSGIGSGYSAPASFAYLGTRYFHHYSLGPDEGKRLLAEIAVKNHYNGSLNPKAHFHNRLTVEQVVKAPIVAWPLGLYDCCGVSDGAAAAIVTRADMAKNFRADPIYIKGLAISVGARQGSMRQDYDYVHIEENVLAAGKVYQEAGIRDPRKEISIAEVHDCFTIAEIVVSEDLGLFEKGKGGEAALQGWTSIECHKIPVNTSGGLKSKGHPVGATGIAQIHEIVTQLRGDGGARQLKRADIGLTHNIGGTAATCVVSIFRGR